MPSKSQEQEPLPLIAFTVGNVAPAVDTATVAVAGEAVDLAVPIHIALLLAKVPPLPNVTLKV